MGTRNDSRGRISVATLVVLFGMPFSFFAYALPKPSLEITEASVCRSYLKESKKVLKVVIEDAIEKNGFKVGIGSRMTIRVDKNRYIEGTFLGRMVSRDRKSTDFLFYHYVDDKIYVVNKDKFDIYLGSRRVGESKTQPILDPLAQPGETCAAYAIDHFFHVLDLNEIEVTGSLREKLSTEDGRTNLLVQLVEDYYINERKHNNINLILKGNIKSLVKSRAEKLGLNCRILGAKDPARFVADMLAAMTAGSPVILEFYIGQNMRTTQYQVVDPDKLHGEDRRLWIPRKRGEKNGGGHAIVASNFFYSPKSDRLKFMVQDSDWEEPRAWDVEEYITKRRKTSGMIAHVCLPR